MRRLRSLWALSLLALVTSGCVMVIDGGLHSARIGKHKRIVEINGELYVIDLEESTAKKLDAVEPSTGTTKIEVETATHGK